MAHIVSDSHISGNSFGLGAVRAFFQRIGTAWAQQASFRQTYHELDRLTDAELYDLGMARGDITRIAFEAAYGTEQK